MKNTFNLAELLNRLDDFAYIDDENECETIPVYVAYQPNYPMQVNVREVNLIENEDGKTEIYLVTGHENDYLPGYVREEIGW